MIIIFSMPRIAPERKLALRVCCNSVTPIAMVPVLIVFLPSLAASTSIFNCLGDGYAMART
jgi:hypothetical protein